MLSHFNTAMKVSHFLNSLITHSGSLERQCLGKSDIRAVLKGALQRAGHQQIVQVELLHQRGNLNADSTLVTQQRIGISSQHRLVIIFVECNSDGDQYLLKTTHDCKGLKKCII